MLLTRRSVLVGGLGLAAAAPALGAPSSFDQTIAGVESRLGGRIGVAALDTGTGVQLAHRGDERFAMCSTFKWLLAANVLARVDRHQLKLDQTIAFSEKDVLFGSQVTKSHLADGHMTLDDTLMAAVEFSDNTAANLLLAQIGGPSAVTAYLRGIGDSITRLDRTEPELNSNLPGDPRDTTTPNAIVATMKTVLCGDALSSASRERLLGWMKGCRTGLDRLRAGLPVDWVAGDKTGTGFNGPTNDNAIAWPPGRSPILIAAYVDTPKASGEDRVLPHAMIAALIVKALA